MSVKSTAHRWLYIGSLMLAGESIYMLLYMRKTVQTSMEESFGVSAVEIGTLNGMHRAWKIAWHVGPIGRSNG